MKKIIGSRLLFVRKKSKCTQKELSKSLTITKQVISNIERGVTTAVNDYVMKLLSYIFKVDSKYFSGEIDFEEAKDLFIKATIHGIYPDNYLEKGLESLLKKIEFEPNNKSNILKSIMDYLRNENDPVGLEILEETIKVLNTNANNKNLLIRVLKCFNKENELEVPE